MQADVKAAQTFFLQHMNRSLLVSNSAKIGIPGLIQKHLRQVALYLMIISSVHDQESGGLSCLKVHLSIKKNTLIRNQSTSYQNTLAYQLSCSIDQRINAVLAQTIFPL